MTHPKPPEEYANKIVIGLNSFLDNSEATIDLLKTVEEDYYTRLIFGAEDSDVPNNIEIDDGYTLEDGGYFFTFGMSDQKHLIIETDIENVNRIDCDEHVGESVGCFIDAAG